jgi:hypothetical protein
VFAQEQLSITASGTRHVTVKPSRAGRKLIAHHSRPVRITLSVTFKAASGKAQRKTVRGLLVAK